MFEQAYYYCLTVRVAYNVCSTFMTDTGPSMLLTQAVKADTPNR